MGKVRIKHDKPLDSRGRNFQGVKLASEAVQNPDVGCIIPGHRVMKCFWVVWICQGSDLRSTYFHGIFLWPRTGKTSHSSSFCTHITMCPLAGFPILSMYPLLSRSAPAPEYRSEWAICLFHSLRIDFQKITPTDLKTAEKVPNPPTHIPHTGSEGTAHEDIRST